MSDTILHVIQGGPALSLFRLAALKHAIQGADPALCLSELQASEIFVLETSQPLDEKQWDSVAALLDTRVRISPMTTAGFFVTPRKGTISPWSSKATDIFHNCGFSSVTRIEHGIHYLPLDTNGQAIPNGSLSSAFRFLHDRMIEGVYDDLSDIFAHRPPTPMKTVDILHEGLTALTRANVELGLALSDDEIQYLYACYRDMKRNPSDVELVMFGQVNSEHCRHKIFRAEWIIDGARQACSLFDMIRNTHRCHPHGTLLAYEDNSAVMEGFPGSWFESSASHGHAYQSNPEQIDILMKVETHNHPTAISPYPGAATGVGGEIRDEGATGIGGKTKAGLSAFMVSNLRLPDFVMPWETDSPSFPERLAPPSSIMMLGPIGGARFGNEFGRPQLTGIFRTFEHVHNGRNRGYHKPIMVAGGLGNIKRLHVAKRDISAGALIVQLGGPALRIGLGGGAASSMGSGSNAESLDFDSVQRDNAEMQRRCQEVLNACIAQGTGNPILSIHDIGAGGLSNGCPELVSHTGGAFELRNIPNEESSMSPMEIWCCEAQERYVLAIAPEGIDVFMAMCRRERCPAHVIGRASGDGRLILHDSHFENNPIDVNIDVILGKPPKMLREVDRLNENHAPLDLANIDLPEAVQRVLHLPAVASKTFLITIADRSVTGMVSRDQMVGPYQVPISDHAITVSSYHQYSGEAMAMGERTPLAIVSAPASGRMAVSEAITNLASVPIGRLGNVKLSANWMCACGEPGEDAALFDTVRAVGMELCPALGISIPVGKDSLSMRTSWQDSAGQAQRQLAPLSLIVSAFAPVSDVRLAVTPDVKRCVESVLLVLDLGRGRNRLGASALAQVYSQVGDSTPDLDDPQDLVRFFGAVQEMVAAKLLLAYHDRSDGGLFVTLAEMAFGGRQGIHIHLDDLGDDVLPLLFNEELGAVIQVRDRDITAVNDILNRYSIGDTACVIGSPAQDKCLTIELQGRVIYRESVAALQHAWSELTCEMQSRRDNATCVSQEYDAIRNEDDAGMSFAVTYNPQELFHVGGIRPRVAILREQGINGHIEMAAAFDAAGFQSIDVHMTDLLSGATTLSGFTGLVACGGFSYGDVLGAGAGWARSILFNDKLRDIFAAFFSRRETFTLGVCNGCQMVSLLKDIIPGAAAWPRFTRNRVEQFEARYVTVEVLHSPSILLRGMEGSRIPIPVAHGEGLANFNAAGSLQQITKNGLACLRYVDNKGMPAEAYPFNPNGSPGGLTGFSSDDGRVTIMMPHPERAFRSCQLSWKPDNLFTDEPGPWLKMFQNARVFSS